MIEKHIVLEDIDPVVFYGTGNAHLQMMRALYPKLRIVARDNVIRILGDEEQMAAFEESAEKMRQHVLHFNALKEEDILDIIKGHRTKDEVPEGVVCYSMSGRPIKARSENQQKLIDAYERNDMVFAVGPAGTGKTYLSIALAVKALKEKTAKKIILSRPAVEAGEKLGFLPGDMKDKIDPYLQPLYDALEDMLPQVKLQDMMGEARHTDSPTRLYARQNAERCSGDSGRGAEHDPATDPYVPDAHGMEYEDDYHGRHDTDRPAEVTTLRTGGGAEDSQRRGGHRCGGIRTQRHCASQTGDPHCQGIRTKRQTT